MDAAHKLFKTAGLLLGIALLMAAPAWTQVLTPSTTAVSLTGSQGQDVTVTSSVPGTPITFTIGTAYAADNGGVNWLGISGTTTTPTTLAFNLISTAGLSQGTHTATVTLTPTAPAGVAAVTITVTYTSGSPGGGSGTLTATPNPINVSAPAGGQITANVTISTTSTTPVFINSVTGAATTGGASWLEASLNGNSSVVAGTATTVLVTANAFNLPSNTVAYQGTVTVTPATGTVLTIPVNFTVGGSGGGNGSWTVSQNSVAFTYNTGSGIFPSTALTVTNSSGFTSYNAAATSAGGWLLVNGSTVVNPAIGTALTVQVGSQANTLTTGTYQGTVTISDPTGFPQLTIGVTLNVNGGNSSGLTISPNPLNLTAALNGAQQNPQVTVTSSTGGTLAVTGSLPSWLTGIQLPGNTNLAPGGSTAFSLTVNPFGLAATTYTASLNVTVGSQSGTLNVTLAVGGTGTGTGGTAVAPNSLNFAYQAGTATNLLARPKIVITGPAGAWSSVITTSNNGNWLQLSSSGGASLPDPTNSPTAFIDPTGLAVGNYTGNIAITTAGGTQNVSVALMVTQGALLVPTPGSLVFVTPNPQSQTVFFSGSDSTVGALSITATPNNPWIKVTASAAGMSVSVDPTGLATGVYSGSITINQVNVANNPYTYPVVLVVNGGTGTLTFTPASLSFSGPTPAAATLSVSANTPTSFTYATTYQSGSGWLSISASSNLTPATLTVSAFPAGLVAGTYNATISFTSNGSVQTVPVTLTVGDSGGTGGNVTVSPTSLTFSGSSGATSLAAQALTVTSPSGTANVNFTVTPTTTSGGNWLSANITAVASTPSTFNVSANPSGLSAGTYSGNLAVQPTGGALVNVPVTLTITATPTVTVTPATPLTFAYRAGDTIPAPQTLLVSGGGTALAFTATAVSDGNWLVVTPTTGTTGTTPASISVSVNPGTLAAGQTYNGTVTIAGTNGATGSTTVNVSLTVTAPLPTVTKVTNAGSYATGNIAPGEIITLFASDPTHPIGPTTAVGLTLDTTGKVATTIGGVQVLINGFPAPMIFASATQVSAVVPYELAQFTGSNVPVLVKFLGQSSNGLQVTVAATAPGLFTANASGTGPGAILNSNNCGSNCLNSPANPATRGDVVVVYMTGEGQTSPAGVTGKVTTVSSTPPLTPAQLLPISITVGGQPANYTFAGEAPGFVSGAMQLNVLLPTNIGTGEQEIVVTIGGNQSQRSVTVSVK